MSRTHRPSVVLLWAAMLCGASSVVAQEARTDGWVVLPVEDYRALREKAFPPEPTPEPPPVDAALTRVDYDLRVASDSASGEARLTVDVFKDGWVRVPIPSGLLVREARLDGRPVSLIDAPGKRGASQVLLSKTGRSVLSLDVALRVSASAGTESVTLPAAPSAVSRAALAVVRKGVDLTLSGGLLAERADSGSESRYVAYGRPGEALTFSWRGKREDHRAEQPLRLRGSVTEWVGLGEDGSQVSAEIDIEVVQGVAPAVTVSLPEGLVVNQVSGAAVADWDFRPGRLVVTFLEPVEGKASLVLAGETRTPREGSVDVPLVRLAAAERESGGVAVEVLGAGEIKDQQPKGLETADPSDLGGPVAGRDSPSLAAFRFRPQEGKAPRSLVVSVARYTPQAVLVANVEEARYQVLIAEDGKVLVRARYAVRNNQRSFLALRLPEGATLWSASVAGRPARPGRSEEGALLLPLEKGRAGEDAPAFAVELVYLGRDAAWQKQGRSRLAFPALDLQVSRTGIELHRSPRYRVTPQPGPFRETAYEEPFSEALRRAAVPSPPSQQAKPAPGLKGAEKKDEDKSAADEVQGLLERFQKQGRVNRAAGVLPVQVPFPAFGPSSFLVSELTAEATAPALELAYRRDDKGGER